VRVGLLTYFSGWAFQDDDSMEDTGSRIQPTGVLMFNCVLMFN
jgi:hypothetical protein